MQRMEIPRRFFLGSLLAMIAAPALARSAPYAVLPVAAVQRVHVSPVSPSFAVEKPHCWIVPGLPEHVQRWNHAINRDGHGKPLSVDYDQAARLLALHLPRLAIRRLEKVIRDTRPELDATGLPEDAAHVAGLIAACGRPPRPARRNDQQPALTEAHIRRELPPASARVMLIDPPRAATSR